MLSFYFTERLIEIIIKKKDKIEREREVSREGNSERIDELSNQTSNSFIFCIFFFPFSTE